ncbi:MAG: GNAT family N-acetyltransferase [bacterium]|nr:GNAT family N-acetyltransferase [bacterium]
MNIQYRQGMMEDLDGVFALVQAAVADMNQNGIPQWDEIYPDRGILEEDILKKQLFIGTIEGQMAVIYVLNQECDPEYQDGKWRYPEDSFNIIHRLCVNPAFQGMGVGRQTEQHIEQVLIQKGIQSIRLDAFTKNPHALRMYEKLGYEIVGHADWRKGRFYLMEKHLISA